MARRKQRFDALERQLLLDIQGLTGQTFVDEDLWCGKVPFDGKLTKFQTGPPVPFSELTWREQADVLREFIDWDRYPARAWNDEYRIRENITAGKKLEQWLDGTSLRQTFRRLAEGKTPPMQCPEITQQDLANVLGEIEAGWSTAKADTRNISLRDLRHGSQEQEKCGDDQKSKSRDIER